jgi:uncharacterized membrane protein YdjX (TVP38/TMEM64 family)
MESLAAEENTSAVESPADKRTIAQRLKQALPLVLSLVLSGLLVWLAANYRHQILSYGRTSGLLGVFVVSLVGNATVVIPIPVWPIITAAGTLFSPLLVGIVSGFGGALGELTGYMAGAGGKALISTGKLYERIHGWVTRWGALAIVALAAIPNPFFDVGGFVAGATRLGAVKFVLAAWVGKGLRYGLGAWAFANGMEQLTRMLH